MSYRDDARRALQSSQARKQQNQFFAAIKTDQPCLKEFADVEAIFAVCPTRST